MGIKLDSPMLVAQGQQYNTGEKPFVILYTYYIIRQAGTLQKPSKKTNDGSGYNPVTFY